MNWNPIETAPKEDGKWILLWVANTPVVAYWNEHSKEFRSQGHGLDRPSHWCDITPPSTDRILFGWEFIMHDYCNACGEKGVDVKYYHCTGDEEAWYYCKECWETRLRKWVLKEERRDLPKFEDAP